MAKKSKQEAMLILLDAGRKWLDAYEGMRSSNPRGGAAAALDRYKAADVKRTKLRWKYRKILGIKYATEGKKGSKARGVEIDKKVGKPILRKAGSEESASGKGRPKLGATVGREGRQRLHLRKSR